MDNDARARALGLGIFVEKLKEKQAEIDKLVEASSKLLNACTTEEKKYRELILANLIAKYRKGE